MIDLENQFVTIMNCNDRSVSLTYNDSVAATSALKVLVRPVP